MVRILKMGNQGSSQNLQKKKQGRLQKLTIGILSFEVANVISKTIHLHFSLTDQEIHKLKNEVFKSEGVKRLVSCDESYLLDLALTEKLEELSFVASVVSRLGKKCVEPALQGFEHVFGDLVNGVIGVKDLGFLVKDMDGMLRKMEGFVQATSNLYCELEALNELQRAAKKFQVTQNEETRRAIEQKVIWQRQDVCRLEQASLWNQTYDKVVELLARTICTIYARICVVFGDPALDCRGLGNTSEAFASKKGESRQPLVDVQSPNHINFVPLKRLSSNSRIYSSGSLDRNLVEKKDVLKPKLHSQKEVALFQPADFVFPCGTNPGRLFMECLSLSSSVSKADEQEMDDYDDQSSRSSGSSAVVDSARRVHPSSRFRYLNLNESPVVSFGRDHIHSWRSVQNNSSRRGWKSKLNLYAHSSTVGGSALALRYANVIIVIEKLLRYPHLVGEEARNDLYHMLPTSLRMSLKAKLKFYFNNLAIYDAPLAHSWKENLEVTLRWLGPLAHNMIKWQSDRNIEQHQFGSRTNILLLQTLHFADREKTEAAICDLLAGLNYICRFEHQQNVLLDCASSFDFDNCKEWQLQSSHLQ